MAFVESVGGRIRRCDHADKQASAGAGLSPSPCRLLVRDVRLTDALVNNVDEPARSSPPRGERLSCRVRGADDRVERAPHDGVNRPIRQPDGSFAMAGVVIDRHHGRLPRREDRGTAAVGTWIAAVADVKERGLGRMRRTVARISPYGRALRRTLPTKSRSKRRREPSTCSSAAPPSRTRK